VAVLWSPTAGADRYIVRRTFEGGNQFWRGTVDAPATSFEDSNRNGELIYAVEARFGTISTAATTCSEDAEVQAAPTSCAVVLDQAGFTVSWPEVVSATAYVVERSVDGGNWWWRGRVTDTTFADSVRSGSIEYRVRAIGASGVTSEHRSCD